MKKILMSVLIITPLMGCNGDQVETVKPLELLYQQPFKFMGQSVKSVSESVSSTPNKVGNIIVENERNHILFESNNNIVGYVEIDFKETIPCNQKKKFNSKPLLTALGIDPSELELAREKTHFHTYYDHANKLKVGVSCLYDGGPLSVSFSSKYYGK
ncbi:hypothetical protein [Photobacterium indicum]|uniref:Uncharacterized protein n=1 Tax=Photobacterium indicum TaxID=81447 RepID=A0A2T3LEQ2_9GAMM|nr:hypothetical protein [Photobacterium indicum]PSV49860.1 hypothetical protein C9J47_04730 [Photobacterium indicum]